jgi:hypothetical protein
VADEITAASPNGTDRLWLGFREASRMRPRRAIA